ncbi:hypothetical protein COO92_21400 [Thalassospira lohafexi]|uniref:Uncharacterized protein n=1 Tax=Thalassospira lohafexi TaxID=744227 RepID=A0A2N3L0M3_9PROT|nr:hypothetical protein COO92_21400 [Thalassospira lohafexi]
MAEVKASMAPAAQREITEAYVFLQANCVLSKDRASESKASRDLRYTAMIDGLSEYPKDLVLHTLRNWHKTSMWVPVAAEVIQKIEREASMRKSLLECLENAPYRGEKRRTESKGRSYADYTDEEKAAHDARSARVLEMLRSTGEGMKM